jgi:hypothetical protein
LLETVPSATRKVQESQASKPLQLLTNFLPDVSVIWVQQLKVTLEGINLPERELITPEASDESKYIECPAPCFVP